MVGLVILVLLLAHHNHESQFEQAVSQVVRDLPHGIASAVRLFYGLGALWVLGLIVIAAFLSERRRLGRDLLIAGVATWAIARFVRSLNPAWGEPSSEMTSTPSRTGAANEAAYASR